MKTFQELNNEYAMVCQIYGDALFKLEDAEQLVASLKATVEELKARRSDIQQQVKNLGQESKT
jgi:hypothetical protein